MLKSTKCKLNRILGYRTVLLFLWFFAFLVVWSFLVIWISIYLVLWIRSTGPAQNKGIQRSYSKKQKRRLNTTQTVKMLFKKFDLKVRCWYPLTIQFLIIENIFIFCGLFKWLFSFLLIKVQLGGWVNWCKIDDKVKNNWGHFHKCHHANKGEGVSFMQHKYIRHRSVTERGGHRAKKSPNSCDVIYANLVNFEVYLKVQVS